MPGHRRHPAPAPRRRQGQGDGPDPDRPDDGRGRGGALRPRLAHRAGQRPHRGGDAGRRQDRRLFAAHRHDGQGERQPRPSRRRSPRASASSAGCSTPCSPPRTRRKAWPPSSRSARRSSATARRACRPARSVGLTLAGGLTISTVNRGGGGISPPSFSLCRRRITMANTSSAKKAARKIEARSRRQQEPRRPRPHLRPQGRGSHRLGRQGQGRRRAQGRRAGDHARRDQGRDATRTPPPGRSSRLSARVKTVGA